jgi:hypothetical protein
MVKGGDKVDQIIGKSNHSSARSAAYVGGRVWEDKLGGSLWPYPVMILGFRLHLFSDF